ncbi:NAD-dependent epimerase/dehydratase family protein [Gordonia sp. CPCC 205515]|uniref:NAD-dependent epimerase/dehydratase family protein n=1 Tax=Gordonia sp. CPCC 205515 TaxID=3140791 RepID=UPI003AF3D8B4
MRALVTGATGYVGSRLVCALLAAGHDVVVTSHRPESVDRFGWSDEVSAVPMDVDDPSSVTEALQSTSPIDVVYYLVHGIGSADFGESDALAAGAVAKAAADANVRRIVYLGGFVPDGDKEKLSTHLRSRAAVGEALEIDGGADLVWLRAAVILGAGSTSFEIIRYVADRLAVIPEPGWANNPMDPISVRDVVHYLVAVADPDIPAGAYDIAGPDEDARYRTVLSEYLHAIRQPRLRIPVPHVSTKIAGRVAGLLVPVPTALTADLVTSLNHPMHASEHAIRDLVPDPPGGLTSMHDAVEKSVRTPAPRAVDALVDVHHLADTDPEWAGGDLMRLRRRVGSVVDVATRPVRNVVSMLTG